MIDTKTLQSGDICLVNIEREDETTVKNILCIFTSGGFQDLTDKNTYQVYGSNVFKFEKIQTLTRLYRILGDKLASIESDNLERNTCDKCGHMLHFEHLECPMCGGKKFTQVETSSDKIGKESK